MPLDPQIQALRFQREREKAPPLYTLSVEQARQADLASVRAGAGTPESVAQVINHPIPGPAGDIPLRLYQPGGEGSFPVLISFFGGGWTLMHSQEGCQGRDILKRIEERSPTQLEQGHVQQSEEQMLMGLSIHRLTEAELEATDEVIMTAYNIQQSRKETLHRYLALQPQGSYVAKDNGTVIGFGAAMDYGPFAYIGLMSVHPSRQKQGVGRLLLEQLLSWIESRGCSTVLLDATPVGIPLYEQFGFMEDDQTVVLRQTQHLPFPRSLPAGVRTLREKDLAQVVAFDAPCFGAQRGAVLTSYWADNPQRAIVTHNAKGQITGYLLAQPQTLGPWVALTAEDAEPLLVHALALPFASEPGVFVAAHNRNALHLLERYGFREQRVLSHMWKGQYVQRSRHATLYGQASLGLG